LTELATDGLDLSSILVSPTAVGDGGGGPSEDIYAGSFDNDMLDALGDLTEELPDLDDKSIADLDDAVMLESQEEVDDDV
jgi:hypothetical protein